MCMGYIKSDVYATRNSGRNPRLPHTACLLLYLGLSLLG